MTIKSAPAASLASAEGAPHTGLSYSPACANSLIPAILLVNRLLSYICGGGPTLTRTIQATSPQDHRGRVGVGSPASKLSAHLVTGCKKQKKCTKPKPNRLRTPPGRVYPPRGGVAS